MQAGMGKTKMLTQESKSVRSYNTKCRIDAESLSVRQSRCESSNTDYLGNGGRW